MPSPRTAATLIAAFLVCAVDAPQQKPRGEDATTVDTQLPLAARVGEPDPSVLQMFADAGLSPPVPHAVTPVERASLERAFATLPAAHRKVLRTRLRRVSFLDGMPNTALTSTVESAVGGPRFDLTIRASVLRETVSEFLTWKERTCFDLVGSRRTVEIQGGALEAIVYVLLHEASHMVDSALGLTPAAPDAPVSGAALLTAGVWTDRLVIAAPYASPLLEGLSYRRGGRPVPIAEAGAVYAALQQTPFVSLYASSNWHDDVAELMTWRYLTSRLGQPYRIVVRDAGRLVLTYEPMTSSLVQRRLPLVDRYLGQEPPA